MPSLNMAMVCPRESPYFRSSQLLFEGSYLTDRPSERNLLEKDSNEYIWDLSDTSFAILYKLQAPVQLRGGDTGCRC